MAGVNASGFKTMLKKLRLSLRGTLSNIGFVRLFSFWEMLGFHITPNRFDQPIPDTRTLTDDIWLRRSELVGIDMNEQNQLQLLKLFSSHVKEEYEAIPKERTANPSQYYANNPAYGVLDAELLYYMIRHFKPKKIVEIGSGYSTYLSAQSILRNEEETGKIAELIAVEPYPSETLKRGFPGLSKLIVTKVENVELNEFTSLQENDILFIDSSHVLKIGNDVQYEYLEILPRLNKGVIVHIHDIFLPMEYPKEWVLKRHWFWNEQYLLQAFLAFNYAFEVLWSAHFMHMKHPERLEEAFRTYNRRLGAGGSFWVRKKA